MHYFPPFEIKKINNKSNNHTNKNCIKKNQKYSNIQKNISQIQKNISQRKQNIIKYISNLKYSNFSEKFELLNYINSGREALELYLKDLIKNVQIIIFVLNF